MKIVSIVGARPQFIKAVLVCAWIELHWQKALLSSRLLASL